MLRDKLTSQNRRWESICNQVANRRDRLLSVFKLFLCLTHEDLNFYLNEYLVIDPNHTRFRVELQ